MFRWFRSETVEYLLNCRIPAESYRSAWSRVYPRSPVPVITVPMLDNLPTTAFRYRRARESDNEKDSGDEGGTEVGI